MCIVCMCWVLYNYLSFFFFFNDTATTEIYTLSLHDALPISRLPASQRAAVQLVVASPPEHAHIGALRRRAGRLGVAGDLLLTGFVGDDLLLALYRACLAHVMPSGYEGFGLPTLEAMRCGAAAVVSDIPSLRELVPD